MTINKSFTVCFKRPKSNVDVVIIGVTSIFPNMNGILFATEDTQCYLVEYLEMVDDNGTNMLCNMRIEYSTEEDIAWYLQNASDKPEEFYVLDGRE